ncbi:MAG TPA: hypothetical protein VFI61_03995 [Patescibacteria group bacterium]|nr:hypothetical protein [Patescibacteria group bacterium]
MKIKLNFVKSIVTAFFLFLVSGVFAINATAAPRLFFDPSPVTLPSGVDTEIKLQIDAESNSVFGADAVVNFPAGDLTITSVTSGGFFSDFSYAPSSGKLEIHAYFGSAFDSKSGAGTLAIIKVKSNKTSGAGQITFTCTGSGETEILRASDGQNILTCSSLTTLTASYGTSNSDTNSNSNTPNSCGGTCGSNYNCNSDLYCYSGFCRNPNCPTSLTCGCVATAKPTIKASGTPKPIKPTPQVVTLAKYTASPSASPASNIAEQTTSKYDVKTIGVWAGVAVLVIVLLSMLASFIKGKNKPPQIMPPTTIEPPITPPNSIPTQEVPPLWESPPQNPPQTPPTF